METSTKSYRINITNPVYCVLQSDTVQGTTYGEVKEFGEAMEMLITPSTADGKLYGNGAVVDSSSRLTGITAAYSATKIPVEVIADIYDYKITNGVVQVEAGKEAKLIAVGYMVEQTNGKNEYTWLLKGRPKPMSKDLKQSDSSVQYSTDKIEIDFMRRISDKMLKYYADEANPAFTKEQADKWFKNGPSSVVSVSNTVSDSNTETQS